MKEITVLPVELPEPSFFFSQEVAEIKVNNQTILVVLNLQSGDIVFRVGGKQIAIPLQDIVNGVIPQLAI